MSFFGHQLDKFLLILCPRATNKTHSSYTILKKVTLFLSLEMNYTVYMIKKLSISVAGDLRGMIKKLSISCSLWSKRNELYILNDKEIINFCSFWSKRNELYYLIKKLSISVAKRNRNKWYVTLQIYSVKKNPQKCSYM